MKTEKVKPKVKVDHLINWYFGNYCAKCGKIDLQSEDYGQKCFRKMQEIKGKLRINEMAHKEFIDIMRRSLFCNPFARKFDECKLCKKTKISNKYFIKKWDGWNLSEE